MQGKSAVLALILLLVAAAILVTAGGCARGTATGTTPSSLMDVVVTYVGPVNDSFYYYVPIDADNNINDGPIPVAAGPYWGNGWGTGSMTHYVEYHAGIYRLFRVLLTPDLRTSGGGITAVAGAPVVTKTGLATIEVGALTFGAATVSGTGMITSVANSADQNAGALTVATDAGGNLVAGSVVFTPASPGGRGLTGTELSQVNSLGGQPLAADSFSFLGLTLTLGATAAGSQTITVAPTTAAATAHFVGDSPPQISIDTTGTLTANSAGSATNTLVPGLLFTTGDLVSGGQATIGLVTAQEGTLLGTPYDFTPPRGGNTLRFTLDISALAPQSDFLSINFISVTQLIFDPQALPSLHVYDGQGPRGNDFVTIRLDQFTTYKNGDSLVVEGANDTTLQGNATDTEKASVDLIDWSVTVRRL
jgi:hypothetical protein